MLTLDRKTDLEKPTKFNATKNLRIVVDGSEQTKQSNNRIQKIKKTKDIEFGHAPGEKKPADVQSRGLKSSKLSNLKSRWEGPEWLRNEIDQCSTTPDLDIQEKLHSENQKSDIQENLNSESQVSVIRANSNFENQKLNIQANWNSENQRSDIQVNLDSENQKSVIRANSNSEDQKISNGCYSSLTSDRKSINMQNKEKRKIVEKLNLKELNKAKIRLIKSDRIECLKLNKNYDLFLDEYEIIQCKSRLKNSELNFEFNCVRWNYKYRKKWFCVFFGVLVSSLYCGFNQSLFCGFLLSSSLRQEVIVIVM
jgi:hypothetical protein